MTNKTGMREKVLQRVKQKRTISDAGLPSPSDRKHWRDALKLTQKDAADLISEESGVEVSRPQFANWELGMCNPRSDLLPFYKDFLATCFNLMKVQNSKAAGKRK